MTYTQGLALGLVQGLTEFLPVSSSAHLLLVPYLLGWPDQGLAVDAMLHGGTLIALIGYFRHDLRALLVQRCYRRVGFLVLVATIPAGLAALIFEDLVSGHLRSPVVVAAWSAGAALAMGFADRHVSRPGADDISLEDVRWGQALGVGALQALAVIPGTSRSGIAITAGLLGGLDRATAARFAFLLGIPITAMAATFETGRAVRAGIAADEIGPLLAAFGAAAVSGWLAVRFLMDHLRRRSLMPFVVYRLALAATILAVTGGCVRQPGTIPS